MPLRGRLVVVFLGVCVGIALQIAGPQLLSAFIDSALAQAAVPALVRLGLLFMGVAASEKVVTAVTRYLSEDIGWLATNRLRGDLASHCLSLDLSFHRAHTPGELIERIDGDVNALTGFLSQFVVGVVANALLLTGVLIALSIVDWRIGVTMTGFTVLAMAALWRIRELAVPHWAAVRSVSADFFGFLGEVFGSTADLRANGATGYVYQRFHKMLRRWYPRLKWANLAHHSMWMSSFLVFGLGTAVALAVGAYLFHQRAISVGSVYLIVSYTALLRKPLDQIRTQLQDLQKAGAGIGRIGELLALAPLIAEPPVERRQTLPPGPLAVELEQVSFAYDQSEGTVLSDLDFALAPGEVVGVLGRTGSGKTTMARLLARLSDPTSGRIALGGRALLDVSLADLRQRVGFVTQEVQLIQASVRDNVTLFREGFTDERVTEALTELGLGSWLAALPDGLATQIGNAGRGLSAGEAQLLALTRLFLDNPGLIILDEASSRIDPLTEGLLERALDRALAGRTAVIIAHRLATVQRADRILILENGRVLELGKRSELLADPDSHFNRLLRTDAQEVLA